MTYDEFIESILSTRGRFNCGDEYHERHHILPKCMGGTNEASNLIDLYAREHFEAHRLLAEENPNEKKLAYAWWNMAHCSNNNKQIRYLCSADEYEEARIAWHKYNNGCEAPFYGHTHSEASKQKISQNLKGKMVGEKNPMYGRVKELSPSYGVVRSQETKDKLSASRKIQRSVCQYDENGCLLRIFENEYDACDSCGMFITSLRDCYKHPWHKAFGFYWVINNGVPQEKIKIPKNPNSKKSKKIVQYSFTGEKIAQYNSIKDAERATGISSDCIVRVCKRKAKIAGSFVWRYLKDEEDIVDLSIQKYGKAKFVKQYSKEGMLLNIFESLTQASKLTNTSLSSISQCCNKKAKYANGYMWEFGE